MEDLTMDEKYLFFYTLGMKVAEAEMEKEAAKKKGGKVDVPPEIQKALKKAKRMLDVLPGGAAVNKYFKMREPNVIERIVGGVIPTKYKTLADLEKMYESLGMEPKDIKKLSRYLGIKDLPWYKGGEVSRALLRTVARHPTAAGVAGLAALLGGGYAAGKGIEALTD
jgi:hypothetical protein